jgi:hypothetical protein
MKRADSLLSLPAAGYDQPAPPWPLKRLAERHEQEMDRWEQVWRTPQAAAWANESWRWPIVALWVRTFVSCEDEDAPATLLTALHRLADQIGMTPAGLKENGWRIVADEVGERRAERAEPGGVSARDRLRLLRDATGS